MRSIAHTLAVLLVVGCGSDLDPASRVTALRILATRADLPFAHPGETVHVDALAVDPSGNSFALAWTTCDRPSSTTATGCVDALASAPGIGGSVLAPSPSFAFTVPPDALDGVPADAVGSVYDGVVTVACPGVVAVLPGPGGSPIRCTDASGSALPLGRFDIGVKRVFFRRVDRNANPTIDTITFDGAPWLPDAVPVIGACASATESRYDDCDGESHAVAIVPTGTSFESGSDELGNAFREEILAQYYATDGIFEYGTRDAHDPSTKYKARSGSAGRTVSVWFVLRDDRGGVAWDTRTLQVR